jgi:hypothetical protein
MMFSPEKCRDRAAECLQWAESASSLRPRDIGFDVLEVENFLVDAFDLSTTRSSAMFRSPRTR